MSMNLTALITAFIASFWRYYRVIVGLVGFCAFLFFFLIGGGIEFGIVAVVVCFRGVGVLFVFCLFFTPGMVVTIVACNKSES